MGRENQIPKIAKVTLETVTPLHIGSGLSVIWNGRQWADCQQILQGARLGATNEPYIPGSTVRGMLRAMYAFTREKQELTGGSDDHEIKKADYSAGDLFGAIPEEGREGKTTLIEFADLWPKEPVKILDTKLDRYRPASQGLKRGKSPNVFAVQLVPKDTVFSGKVAYLGGSLPNVLQAIFQHCKKLRDLLLEQGKGGNPEIHIPGSPIHNLSPSQPNNPLFQQKGSQWTITWKLGRYSKSYSKALSHYRKLSQDRMNPGALPHAYYLPQGTTDVPGWVKITYDLDPHDDKGQSIAQFGLNEWR